jgi:hypothetical protein
MVTLLSVKDCNLVARGGPTTVPMLPNSPVPRAKMSVKGSQLLFSVTPFMVDDTVARLWRSPLRPLRPLRPLLEEPRPESARREVQEPSPLLVPVPLDEPRPESARREVQEPSPLLVPVPREEPRLESPRREVREPNPLLVPNWRSLTVGVGAARLEPTRARTTAVFIVKEFKKESVTKERDRLWKDCRKERMWMDLKMEGIRQGFIPRQKQNVPRIILGLSVCIAG